MTPDAGTPEFKAQLEAIFSKPTMTVDEMGIVLGVGRNQAYRAVREGKIRSLRIGTRILIPTTAVRAFLEGRPE